ncbi:MAG: LPXTG cell wall anchor domain-containing protein [Clostridia bacterium]|nr:LPXTG cell wall anchor domain-containing protein [Clostridia bacterium]
MNRFVPIAHLLTAAPLTGDEGMTPILIVAVVGVVLVGAFLALTAIQKKRNANKEDDGE